MTKSVCKWSLALVGLTIAHMGWSAEHGHLPHHVAVAGGGAWHVGGLSIGPVVSYDLIEDESDSAYVGIAVGVGF